MGNDMREETANAIELSIASMCRHVLWHLYLILTQGTVQRAVHGLCSC